MIFGHLYAVLGYIVPFLFVLTLVVFFHEMGHFLVGRWCGVKVDTFSLGFGKELAGFTDRHGTRWRVASVPLGGFGRHRGGGPDRQLHPRGRDLLRQLLPVRPTHADPQGRVRGAGQRGRARGLPGG